MSRKLHLPCPANASKRRSIPKSALPSDSVHLREAMVHGTGRLLASGRADDLRRNAGYRGIMGHRLENDRSGGDSGTMADFDIAEDLGTGSDQDAMADLGMPVAAL